MGKKTINVSEQLLKSQLLGFISSIFIIFISHFFGKWQTSSPVDTNTVSGAGTYYFSPDTKISAYYLDCPIDNYHRFEGNGVTWDNIMGESFNDYKHAAITKDTFDGHSKNIIFIGLLLSGFFYILHKVNFKLVE
jgi:hypothetical protein